MSMGAKILSVLFLLALSFGGGYYFKYRDAVRLQGELEESRQLGSELDRQLRECRLETRLAQLRDLAGHMYLEVSRNNFGVAADLSTRYFDTLADLAFTAEGADLQGALKELLQERDAITAGLATSDAALVKRLQELFLRTQRSARLQTQNVQQGGESHVGH